VGMEEDLQQESQRSLKSNDDNSFDANYKKIRTF
jgi:hypothetical protein